VSRNRLQAYGLDISRITQLLYAENQNIAGGKVYEGVYKYIVRTVGEFRDLDDIGNIVVTTTRSGIPIKLKEIAAISYGYDEDRGVIRINRQNGLTIQLFKESGENTVLTARAVRKKLKELKNILPANIEFNIMFDSSEDIERAIDSVITVALQGIFFAVIVLMLFLWNIRTVLIIAVSIPTSIIVTFIAMYAFDVNLNIISLSGLALGVGMMVDSSIVVLENIFHFRLKGMGKYSAAGKGARQVALAITASTLTTIVIFVPFLIVEGMVKEIFWDLALTVSISLLASLLVSLTVIPMLSSKMISIKESSFIKPLETRFNKLLQRIDEHYENILKHALHRKKIIVFTTLILTFVIGGAILATIGKESFPENDEGKFSITATFPPGTRLEATDTLVKKMENDITAVCGDLLEVLSVQISGSGMFAAFIGASEYKANIRVRLTPVTEREQGVKTVMEKVRKKLTRYPARMKIRSQGGMQGGAASKFSIEIRGDNLKQGNNIADKILSRLKKVKGIREPEIDKDDQLPEISLHIKRDLASKVGLNASHIANTIRTGFGSTTAGTMKTEDGTDIDIKVRLRKNDSRTLEDILSLSLPTPSGKLVPLASILNTEKTISPAGIKRKDQKRIVTINADIFGRPINEVMDDVKETIKKNVYIPRSFDIVYGGSYKDMQESFADLKLAFILAIVLVYAIM
ncbi:MAG TPA: efflux RND transporter permease subunit, partial [Spirochaetota bacterium]|nr:efflux RND transporter permease subunit [Spirochaetota bacterium]